MIIKNYVWLLFLGKANGKKSTSVFLARTKRVYACTYSLNEWMSGALIIQCMEIVNGAAGESSLNESLMSGDGTLSHDKNTLGVPFASECPRNRWIICSWGANVAVNRGFPWWQRCHRTRSHNWVYCSSKGLKPKLQSLHTRMKSLFLPFFNNTPDSNYFSFLSHAGEREQCDKKYMRDIM